MNYAANAGSVSAFALRWLPSGWETSMACDPRGSMTAIGLFDMLHFADWKQDLDVISGV